MVFKLAGLPALVWPRHHHKPSHTLTQVSTVPTQTRYTRKTLIQDHSKTGESPRYTLFMTASDVIKAAQLSVTETSIDVYIEVTLL